MVNDKNSACSRLTGMQRHAGQCLAESRNRTHRRAHCANAGDGRGLVHVLRAVEAQNRLLLSRRAKRSIARCKPLSSTAAYVHA